MLGTALLLLGNGLLGTLIALRGSMEGFSDQTLGLMGSGYFVGFFIGTYAVPSLIRHMGHIRAFNFFAAAIAAFILLHSMVLDPWVWMGLRILTGIALVGFYTVIESWLNSQAQPGSRGQMFAFYMVVNMGSVAAAQQFLHLASPSTFVLFSIAAMMVCFSVMPVASTRLAQPVISKVPRLTLTQIWRAAPVAVVGALACGLTMGPFWSMAPLYATRLGLDEAGVALLVTVMIVGGAVLQWPIGRLSDRYDRRYVLGLASATAASCAAVMALFGHMNTVLFPAAFMFGGAVCAIYPIVVAHLVDHLTQDNILSGNAGILLLYGIGAMIGPALAGYLMTLGGPTAMPAFFVAVLIPLTLYVLLQARSTVDEIVEEPGQFVPLVRTSETAMEIVAAVEEHRMESNASENSGDDADPAEPAEPAHETRATSDGEPATTTTTTTTGDAEAPEGTASPEAPAPEDVAQAGHSTEPPGVPETPETPEAAEAASPPDSSPTEARAALLMPKK